MFKELSKLKQILTRREQLKFALLLCAITAMAFIQALGVASVMPFINLLIEPSMIFENRWLSFIYNSLGFGNTHDFTIFVGLIVFVIIIIANAISALTTWLRIRVSLMNNYRLSKRLLEKYMAMPYTYFLNHNSAELCKNVLAEVDHLTYCYILPLLGIITKLILVIFILFILFWVDFFVSIVFVFLIGVIYAVIYWRVNKKLEIFGSKRMIASEIRYKSSYEAFSGIKEIKVLNREKFFIDRYSIASLQNASYNSWSEVAGQMPRFVLETIAFGGIILYSLFLLLNQKDSRQIIPLAGLFAFAGYRLMPAVQEIFSFIATMRYSYPVLKRIHDDVVTEVKVMPFTNFSIKGLPKPLKFKESISLDKLSYRYPNSASSAIHNINLSIKCNSSIAFVGPTGAGKTTLVDIILGLLVPQKGSLIVDDQKIDEKNLKNWQVNLGYVPQHIYLSDDSIARNIAFGVSDEEIDMSSLKNASRLANIDNFIENELPDRFDTIIGERGIRLSGGQRQRIGIARSLYHDPDVLIFDEATSALDSITEEAILIAMQNIAKLKTLIIIAHRLTTVKDCDMIYMLDKGIIVDSGTYEELIMSNIQFQAMAKVKS
jgi:ATP-binding cassette, subfamily B, bacterial PglK